MAILPSLQEAIKEDSTAKPKPLTLEEYRKRRSGEPKPEPVEVKVQQPKKRGGWKVRFRRKLGELHRLASLCVTKEEKDKFIKQIRALENSKDGLVFIRCQGRGYSK